MKAQVSTVVLARLFRLAAGVLTTILTARLLGPAGQGEYFFIVTIAALAVQFGNLGLHSSNMFQAARDPRLLAPLLGNSSWVAGVVGGGLAVAIVAATYVLEPSGASPSNSIWFTLALVPLGLFFLLGESLLVGLGRTRSFNSMEMLSSAALIVLQLAIGFWTRSPLGFLAARVAALVVSTVALFAVLARGSGRIGGFDATTFRQGFSYSARAYLVALLAYLVLRVNVLILQTFSGFAEVGFFSVAVQFADALEIIPSSVSLVLFPKLLRRDDMGWPLMKKSLLTVAGVMAVACGLVALACEPLIPMVFGPEYQRTVPMLRLMLPQVFFIGLTSVASQYLAALGMPKILLVIWAAALLGVMALGTLLVPAYGGEGSAVALSLTYALVFVLVLLAAIRRRPRA